MAYKDMLPDEFERIIEYSEYEEDTGYYNLRITDKEAERILNTLKIYESTLLPKSLKYHNMNSMLDSIVELFMEEYGEFYVTEELYNKLFVIINKYLTNRKD